MSRFLDALHSGRVLLMDGAMGTQLQRRGLAEGECYELWNLTHADAVRAIHQAYVAAGAKVLLTNSFQANPVALRKHGIETRLAELNAAAVRLAREAIGESGFVLGSIGPWLNGDKDNLNAVVDSLRGADAILLETRSHRQAFADAEAARQASDKPILVSLAFRKTGSGCEILTYDDLTPESCAGLAEKSGCAALGVNCGNRISLGDVLQIIRRFRSATNLPLFARPNAGTPTRVGDEWIYPVTPADFVHRLPELLDTGVRMIGGCCGTTPAYIAAMEACLRRGVEDRTMSMTAARKLKLISVEEYLAGELESPIKHEYLGGVVYAMAGARNVHNTIAGNIHAAVHFRLRGKRCRPFNSDTKVRVELPKQTRFYYPDVSVTCRPNPGRDSFQDEPAVIFEVLSQATRRIDEGEKKDAYLTIPSVAGYLLVEQDMPAVVVFRRSKDGFAREVYQGMDAVIPLQEIEIDLPLAEIYETVEFAPEVEDEEAG